MGTLVSPAAFRVGEWTVHPGAGRLTGSAGERHLPPLLMDLLVLLAGRAGEVVTKDAILDEVWRSRFVSESALTRSIAELRTLLGDARRPPRYIETIPKRGYRLVAVVTSTRSFDEPVVAVLPFENLAGAGEEYFADGMTDALITELGRIRTLRVISRQSVLQFRGTIRDLPAIARALGVDAIVEGTALHVGTRVRLTAQLVAVEPERHLWADRRECDVADVLTVQGELACAVAHSVCAALGRPAADATAGSRPVNPDAHLEYLRARHHWGNWTDEGFRRALAHAGRANELDPAWAPGYEMIALSLALLGYWSFVPAGPAYAAARQAASRALALDPSLGNAHAALGLVHLWEWDCQKVAREFECAVELSPSSETARFTHAAFLVMIAGEGDAAIAEARLAFALDPLSLSTNFSLAWILIFAGDFAAGARQARATIDLYPDAPHAWFTLGHAELGLGHFGEAIAALERAIASNRQVMAIATLGCALALDGRPDAARRLLADLEERQSPEEVPRMAPAMIYAGLGEHDRAFACLERALAERDGRLFGLTTIPSFIPLRSDPRFADLARRIGLPAALPDRGRIRR